MSIECGECERDLRGGHDPSCSRYISDDERIVKAEYPGAYFVDDGTCFRLWSNDPCKTPGDLPAKVSGRHKTKDRCWADAAKRVKDGTRL